MKGELPTPPQLKEFDGRTAEGRTLPAQNQRDRADRAEGAPDGGLAYGVSALGAFDPEVADNSPEATMRKGIRLTSQVPMLVAAHHSHPQRREPVAPDPQLPHAANFLYMLQGKARVPRRPG